MRFPTCLRVFVVLICLCFHAEAQSEFKVKPWAIVVPEAGTINGYAIDFQTNRVIFRPPNEWQLRAEASEKRVTMTSPDRTASFAIRFIPEPSGNKPEIAIDKLREKARERMDGGKIFEEFVFNGPSGPAQTFAMDRGTNAVAKLSSKIAYLPIDGFLVEFTLTSTPAQLPNLHAPFVMVMNSFTVEAIKPKKSQP